MPDVDPYPGLNARPTIAKATPWDWVALAVAVGAAAGIVGIQLWIESARAQGGFRDQGGMIITLCVCPTDSLLWLTAGPLAVLVGRLRAAAAAGSGVRSPWPVRGLLYVGWGVTGLGLVLLAAVAVLAK